MRALPPLLQVPSRLWHELLPICVLIGAIRALAGLAESSEFTILRTSGLGPGRALKLLMQLGWPWPCWPGPPGDIIAPGPSAWRSRSGRRVAPVRQPARRLAERPPDHPGRPGPGHRAAFHHQRRWPGQMVAWRACACSNMTAPAASRRASSRRQARSGAMHRGTA